MPRIRVHHLHDVTYRALVMLAFVLLGTDHLAFYRFCFFLRSRNFQKLFTLLIFVFIKTEPHFF